MKQTTQPLQYLQFVFDSNFISFFSLFLSFNVQPRHDKIIYFQQSHENDSDVSASSSESSTDGEPETIELTFEVENEQ